MTTSGHCPACDAASLETFLEWRSVPRNSCLLLEDRDEARAFPRGDLVLAVCRACGFVTNTAFTDVEYSGRYEETQAYSPTFVRWGRALAERWVHDHGLAGRSVLEIGCGKAEFLVWMLDAGVASGIGIDPGVHPERIDAAHLARLRLIPERWGPAWAHLQADAVVCRHTLEHIAPVGEFLATLRAAIGTRRDVPVLFELPDARRVLEEGAFWDVYHEHCSYFSAGSLARTFARHGFAVRSVALDFDGQYLLAEAWPGDPEPDPDGIGPPDRDLLVAAARSFGGRVDGTTSMWADRVADVAARGGTTVVWGAGSKAVAFLAALERHGVADHVAAAVDVNPHKAGRFLAGTGHAVVAPAGLTGIRPDLVIAMNPVYLGEIRAELDRLGIGGDLAGV